MFKFLSAVTAATLFAIGANAQCNGTQYLQVTLWDSFGDGWDDAFWMLRDPAGIVTEDQSTCEDIEKIDYVYPCDHDPSGGNYYMTVVTHDGMLPKGWWEIYWRVDVFWANGTATGEYHEGIYNSTMVWEYDEVADRWHLVYIDPVPDFTCTGCTGSACDPKPKPKPKPKSAEKSKGGPVRGKGSKGSHGSGGSGGSGGSDEESGASNATQGILTYGPRAVDLTVEMFSEDCNGWNDVTPIGAHWYIADYTLTTLFDDGSLCDGCYGACNICLGDGSYVFRVTGPTFNETLEDIWFDMLNITETPTTDHSVLDQFRYKSWQFCHARGGYNEQLNFHVQKGKCIPDNQLWADEICDELESSSVTLLGVVALGGVSSERFSASDASLVLSALASTVNGWSVDKMAFVGSSMETRSLSSTQRGLNSYTHDIQFTVTFIAEDYGISGATYALVENLVSDMAATLETAFGSGAFTASLVGSASLANNDVIADINSEELVSLEISKIAYTHNHLVYIYDEEKSIAAGSSSVSTGNSYLRNVVIFGVAIAGVIVIAFVGVMTHKFNGYKKLSTESTHVSSHIEEQDDIEIVQNPFANTEYFNNKKIVFPSRRV